MFLSVLFCILCLLDPNSRSMPASSTLNHLLPACCCILCYIAVFPPLLIQAKSTNPYSHLLHFGSSHKLPVSSDRLPFLQRALMHFFKTWDGTVWVLGSLMNWISKKKNTAGLPDVQSKTGDATNIFLKKKPNRHLKYSQLLWDFPSDVVESTKALRGNMSLANSSKMRKNLQHCFLNSLQ